MPLIPRLIGRHRPAAFLIALLVLVACLTSVGAGRAHAATTLLSQGKPATASSTENTGTPASAAVDGNAGTRWSSAFSDPQWLQVDLGASATISQVTLSWEAAYAKAFQVQVSTDGTTWTSIYSTTTGTGGTQTLNVTGSGRYVRMYGTARGTVYGYSLWEFQVFGTSSSTGGSSYGGFAASFWGDTGSIPAANNVLELQILNRTNGQYPDSQVYYSFNGQT
jgi:hypothetical protein